MMQIASLCHHETYDQTGAAVVAIVFLSVFVTLILVDALITAFALNKALTKDEREAELNARIENKELYLKQLTEGIAKAQLGATYTRTPQPTPLPVSQGTIVGSRLNGADACARALGTGAFAR